MIFDSLKACHVAIGAIIVFGDRFVHTLSDILEFFGISGPRHEFRCCESRLDLAGFKQLVAQCLHIAQKLRQLLEILIHVIGQLKWLHVKEFLHYQPFHLTSLTFLLLLMGTLALLLEHVLH